MIGKISCCLFRAALFAFAFIGFAASAFSQNMLTPGFNPQEYLEMLQMTERQADTNKYKLYTPPPPDYNLVYRSKETGFDNRWDLWVRRDQSEAVISIRGTTLQSVSWLANFYAAMIPSTGTIHVNDTLKFDYKLAADSNAFVHAGWTLALAFLAPDIISKIKEYRSQGIRQFIILGHSQGAAIAFLLRSYLYYLDASMLPKDITYKTYCSAAPKPGNLYYAYDFDFITRGGWGYRVVNALDWVPEMPFTVQTIDDLNKVNPFRDVKAMLKKQPLLVRWYGNSVYNKINRNSKKLGRTYQKYLGTMAGKQVGKVFPDYQSPEFSNSNNYSTAGSPVILRPTEEYKKIFVDTGKNAFLHHMVKPYYMLTEENYLPRIIE
jgi:hypothetical protein